MRKPKDLSVNRIDSLTDLGYNKATVQYSDVFSDFRADVNLKRLFWRGYIYKKTSESCDSVKTSANNHVDVYEYLS